MRDIESIDSELRLVAALRRAARERGGPLPSIHVADALLDERRELTGLPRPTSCLGRHSMELLLVTARMISRHQHGLPLSRSVPRVGGGADHRPPRATSRKPHFYQADRGALAVLVN
jgi:hypothetical protein